MLIYSILDHLSSINDKCVLGIKVLSNSHNFQNVFPLIHLSAKIFFKKKIQIDYRNKKASTLAVIRSIEKCNKILHYS
jgi:hypothetical protein